MRALTLKEIIITSFAIFVTHFGIGFVIFPVFLGYQTGSAWPIASLGYIVVGVLVVMLAYFSIAVSRTDIYEMSSKIFTPVGGKIFGIIITLLFPLFILPRVASAGYEMALLPFFPNASVVIFQLIYFSLSAYTIFNPSKVIDRIGKILAPVMIVATVIVVGKGIISPISPPVETGFASPFGAGVIAAYNNMDALAAVLLGGWIMTEFTKRGVEGREMYSGLTKVIIVTAIMMTVVQVAEIFLGSTASDAVKDATIGSLPISIVTSLFGQFGLAILSVLLMLATFTTCAGLSAMSADSFSKVSNGRFSYKQLVIVVSAVGFILSLYGLDNVVQWALPWLYVTYPAVIVIIISASLGRLDKNRMATAFAAYVGLIMGTMEAFGITGVNVSLFSNIIKSMPFADSGLAWVVPSLTAGIIGEIIDRFKNKNVIKEESKVEEV